jgi:uncharacterized protein YndB with AHSA1/START domain/uncharacterized protein YciI
MMACVVALNLMQGASAREAEPAPIRVERVVNAPVESVWRAWTTAEGVSGFLETPAKIELRPGGAYEIYFESEAPAGQRGSESCRVLSYVDQQMVSFTWNAPPKFPGVRDGGRPTFVVVRMDPVDAATTRVRLEHGGWPEPAEAGALADEWKGTHEYFENAWPRVLEALATSLSGGVDAPDPKAGWVYLFVGFSRPDLLQTMTDEEKAILARHAEYIRDLTKKGTVVLAGPCTDMKGPGIVVFQAANEPAARAIMEADPAVQLGIFRAELHPMRLSFVRGRD